MNPMGANPYQFPLYGMSHHQLPWGFPQTTASKFAPELLQYESPNLSKLPHVPRYDGTTDPDDHIDTYEWMMASLKIDERFQCTYFPVTLTGNAGTWFKTLPQGCIRNFAQLKYLFLSNFMQLRRYKGDTNTILGCRQREGESIREYYQRFTKATLDVPGHEEKIVVGAFTQGILPGELSLKLQAKVPTTRVELKEKVERYLRSTEGEEEKKKFLKASQHIHSKRSETTPLQITHRSQSRRDRFDRRYHPHSREDHYRHRSEVHVVGDRSKYQEKNKTRFCEYHKTKSHDTEECSMLKKEMAEKKLSGDPVRIARDLRAQYEKEMRTPQNEKNKAKADKGQEIFMLRSRKRPERIYSEPPNEEALLTAMSSLTFSHNDPRPQDWNGKDALIIEAQIRDSKVHRVFIDGGASTDVMYEHCFRQLPEAWKQGLKPPTGPIVGFTGHDLWPLGTLHLPLTLVSHNDRQRKTRVIEFAVVRLPDENNILLGRTALLQFQAVASTVHGILKFSTPTGPGTVIGTSRRQQRCLQIMAPADLIHQEKKARSNNATEKQVINSKHPDQPVRISTSLPKEAKERLVALLKQYNHVFVWEPSDMVGVDRAIIEHNLNIKPECPPVKQKRRMQAGDRNAAINNEVDQLIQGGIIREAIFPTWIANPVMVKKPNGSWRMCIDYSDLNNACPKDCYPLPEIDQKVESLEGFKYKCFLDAHKGYHQILMRHEDEEKTAFYTNRGTFCYQKMPFGLKNAGATYQRLMDKIFLNQIGRNIEVYVDDMVIKSSTESSLISDVEETFQVLQKAQMKLNPLKCIFGAEEGQFLGYYITNKGILPSPEKIKDFLETKSPKSLKEVQGLNGKLTALGRFLAKSAEKALPLFQTLKGCIDKHNFQWTTEAEEALLALKEALRSPPILARPIPEETLLMYLSASEHAISSVLLVEREKQQMPVYFVSRALQGPEVNYPILEKLVLALVHGARRLRRYFQAHQVEVLSSHPIKQILLKPEKSGRLAKWAIELGEHDIEYRPRTSAKGQVLADFLTEIPVGYENIKTKHLEHIEGNKEGSTWNLYSDGASSKEGSGAGILLISPEGEEITYALKFKFTVSNNEAEYEALLAGLRIAKEMEVTNLHAFSDSLLVTNQVNGTYEAKDKRMNKYVEAVRNASQTFKTFKLQQIPRGDNRKADALSKLASTSFDHLAKPVLVEVLEERSIDNEQVYTLSQREASWTTPYIDYLLHGILPDDPNEAKKMKIRAPNYAIKGGELYRRGYLVPWLKCVSVEEGERIMSEVHAGEAGAHEGARALTGKILRMGIYWPNIYKTAATTTQKCVECQTFAPQHHIPAAPLTSIVSPWPFYQWGIDIVGPFPPAPGNVKFLLVAVDYFSKWIEAEPLATITGHQVIKFVKKNILTRFGSPKVIISDNGLQFAENPFRTWCEDNYIIQRFASVAHPQANGQTEVSNRTLVAGIKKRLGSAKGNWVDELPSVLWSYRTTPRSSTGETPFSLVYGTEAVIPPELSARSLRITSFEEHATNDGIRQNLDLLEEKREEAHLRQATYKSKTESYYNRRVRGRAFKVGDWVLRRNDASHAEKGGKLGPTWEGPYKVVENHLNGAYTLEAADGRPIPRTWNVAHLRKFHC